MDIRTKSQGGEPTYNISVGKAGKGNNNSLLWHSDKDIHWINHHNIIYYETFVTCHRLITLASCFISNKRPSLQLKPVYQTASFDALLTSDELDFWVLSQTVVMSKDDMLGIAHYRITSRLNG